MKKNLIRKIFDSKSESVSESVKVEIPKTPYAMVDKLNGIQKNIDTIRGECKLIESAINKFREIIPKLAFEDKTIEVVFRRHMKTYVLATEQITLGTITRLREITQILTDDNLL
jgi:hypothetical protein